ncbi:MAG: hypothetical protein BECKG1743E_GA0114224_112921, partial [Candidatus Kentron sp. G]
SDHERYPADVKCLGFLYLYVGRYPRNNASRNTMAVWKYVAAGSSMIYPLYQIRKNGRKYKVLP